MHERKENRLLFAVLLALSAGLFVALFNPADHIKADLRADAKGLVMSLEYSAKVLEGQAPPLRRTIVSISQ